MERNLGINVAMIKKSFSLLTNECKVGLPQEYARGIYFGVAIGLVAVGVDFETAKKVCIQCLPDKTIENIIPEGW